MHVRRADSRWQAAVHGFDPYPDRLRRLAEAAEAERRALLFADLCNVKWKPQPGARGLKLAAELNPGQPRRPGEALGQVRQALDQLGVALEGDGFAELAAVFGSLSAAATEIADAARASRPDQPDRLILYRSSAARRGAKSHKSPVNTGVSDIVQLVRRVSTVAWACDMGQSVPVARRQWLGSARNRENRVPTGHPDIASAVGRNSGSACAYRFSASDDREPALFAGQTLSEPAPDAYQLRNLRLWSVRPKRSKQPTRGDRCTW